MIKQGEVLRKAQLIVKRRMRDMKIPLHRATSKEILKVARELVKYRVIGIKR